MGKDVMPPDGWAEAIKQFSRSAVREGERLKSELLQVWSSFQSQREPFVRNGGKIKTSSQLYQWLGRDLLHVESALIQVVGQLQINPCICCLRGNGPWALCVKLPGGDGTRYGCANCHEANRECTTDATVRFNQRAPQTTSTQVNPGERDADSGNDAVLSPVRETHELVALQHALTSQLTIVHEVDRVVDARIREIEITIARLGQGRMAGNIRPEDVDHLQGQYRQLMVAMQQQARERVRREDCVNDLADMMDIMLFRW
ncbi:uncharacterized protein N7446_011727 [Penicillium canescens]|uniref:Uncharacterized protein n=1 Tax=Penicillium canescens TaxID=5083 RepID=A0AAD6IHA3_PENCN|nr:uncharacterized protein N7446_011727 [Penicillium canescens]KAJ6028932.1 hypothetical protein N7444_011919 [Penicillium canescens]KAJ6047366.1 hypothetical protein N7460_003513 [Penicillium canescens]KAJ6049044.1 hypothetical protein N7446_011727 [Penicillium canescens]KAJ6172906.1 hypothetical protein N7485_005718 [Penicillium canescens]